MVGFVIVRKYTSARNPNTSNNDPETENDKLSIFKQIIFGSLLGDGYLELRGRSVNARFTIGQTVKHQTYLESLYQCLASLCSTGLSTYTYLDARTNTSYTKLSFKTRSYPFLTAMYHMFYLNGTKIIPLDLSLLTPLALAHWVMQDGSLGSSGGIYLCTDMYRFVYY